MEKKIPLVCLCQQATAQPPCLCLKRKEKWGGDIGVGEERFIVLACFGVNKEKNELRISLEIYIISYTQVLKPVHDVFGAFILHYSD